MSMQFQIFIGYDPRQPVAYHVAAHSVVSRLSRPVPVTRLQLNQLPVKRRGLTEFTYSRFLVPSLSAYDGYSLFLDADMLVLGDVTRLLDEADKLAAVSVVMHAQAFERPSLMLFNNKRCQNLTPEFVQDPKNGLFDLKWAAKVGALRHEWNFLVGYDQKPPATPFVIHYTKGVPCWPETRFCDYANEWDAECTALTNTVSFQELMGGSVHVAR